MSISINKVNKFYGKQQVLTDISFSLKKGEVVGFLGPNGAGKSTLMKIICCYLQQDSGKVQVCDLDTQENDLLVKNQQFLALGLKPTTLAEGLLAEVVEVAQKYAHRIDRSRIPAISAWTRDIGSRVETDPEHKRLKSVS